MKRVPVEELQEGGYFDAPVYLDEKYILLSPDTPITAELVERLRRWGYRYVDTEGNAAEVPPHARSGAASAHGSRLDLDIRERKSLEEARRIYYDQIHFVVELFARFREDNRINLGVVTEKIKELIGQVKSSRDAILRFAEFPHPAENYLYQHSVNSAVLALAVGELLKLPPHRLIELGIAALLHDIGMLKLPESLYMSAAALDEQSWKMVRAHTTLGYRILKAFSVSDDIALAAFEHHERLDGSGYPRGLVGDKIHLYARVVAATCSYDAITGKRAFREAADGHHALLDLLQRRKVHYDEAVIRALLYCLSFYPLGYLVRLEDGSVARVVKSNPENPKYPLVQLVLNSQGVRVHEAAILETGKEGAPGITACLRAEEYNLE